MGEHRLSGQTGTRWQRCRTSPFETPPAAAPQDEVLLAEADSMAPATKTRVLEYRQAQRPGPIKRTAELMGEHRLFGQTGTR